MRLLPRSRMRVPALTAAGLAAGVLTASAGVLTAAPAQAAAIPSIVNLRSNVTSTVVQAGQVPSVDVALTTTAPAESVEVWVTGLTTLLLEEQKFRNLIFAPVNGERTEWRATLTDAQNFRLGVGTWNLGAGGVTYRDDNGAIRTRAQGFPTYNIQISGQTTLAASATPTSVAPGSRVTVSVSGSSVLRTGSAPLPDGSPLTLQAKTGGDWATVGNATTSGGRASTVVTPSATTEYRWTYAGAGNASAATSAGVTVRATGSTPTPTPTPTAPALSLSDGTLINLTSTGEVYVIAGGAPLYVSDFAAVGGFRSYTNVSQAEFDTLPKRPADGALVLSSSGEVFVFAGGAPIYLSSWDAIGGYRSDYTRVDNYALVNTAATGRLSHVSYHPVDGTVLRAGPNGQTYVVQGGVARPGAASGGTVIDPVAIARAGSGGQWNHLKAA
ncbi:hypothetical protein [Motilibacter deserti]|uniref:Uncharacterized protein n=1 Tax=Motilibacter deserti TaxID=2714956 RepID=A0ABX0GSM4_9ACTN|nr:hypothetical protein [Motilibacter deserti]NHC13508.1 hypothetical protein [Motilibacter deserti]